MGGKTRSSTLKSPFTLKNEHVIEQKLIDAIRPRDLLYAHGKHHKLTDDNGKTKYELWEEVSKEVKLPTEACRTKWKSIRDYYVRHKKSAKLKSFLSKYRRNSLKFLEGTPSKTRISLRQRNKPAQSSSEEEDEEPESLICTPDIKEEFMDDDDETPSTDPPTVLEQNTNTPIIIETPANKTPIIIEQTVNKTPAQRKKLTVANILTAQTSNPPLITIKGPNKSTATYMGPTRTLFTPNGPITVPSSLYQPSSSNATTGPNYVSVVKNPTTGSGKNSVLLYFNKNTGAKSPFLLKTTDANGCSVPYLLPKTTTATPVVFSATKKPINSVFKETLTVSSASTSASTSTAGTSLANSAPKTLSVVKSPLAKSTSVTIPKTSKVEDTKNEVALGSKTSSAGDRKAEDKKSALSSSKDSSVKSVSHIDAFCQSIAATLKTFPAHMAVEAKSKIFRVVSEMEEQLYPS